MFNISEKGINELGDNVFSIQHQCRCFFPSIFTLCRRNQINQCSFHVASPFFTFRITHCRLHACHFLIFFCVWDLVCHFHIHSLPRPNLNGFSTTAFSFQPFSHAQCSLSIYTWIVIALFFTAVNWYLVLQTSFYLLRFYSGFSLWSRSVLFYFFITKIGYFCFIWGYLGFFLCNWAIVFFLTIYIKRTQLGFFLLAALI